ncbi:hypothetical protein GALMADRAFT_210475 [Galerina marginata CBS 339.88]|uniref:NADP-dependent oxidoreductase domain-containing protein n=1 Tax=Galerina marginata (strain CBS 339.88) TaxID=685588 RepID=A0A067TC08_GALM3|nr:hypothetical protein GALMADRAFT_210475 [Galerina marginata CBS 339.88]
MALPTRIIGKDHVTAIGLGLMGLSAFHGPNESDEERFKFLDAALEAGETNWDSADVYGDNEDLIGKWFKRTGKRGDIFLATKFGLTSEGINGTPEYVRSAAEKSLLRLGVDTIDLYYLHVGIARTINRADKTTPIEITVGAMAELVKEGKIRYLGLSEVSAATLRRAHAVHPIAAVQVEYSPFCLDIEDPKIALLQTCRELGVTVVAYSPLGTGVLTGTFKCYEDIPDGDWRRNVPRFSNENFPNILNLVHTLQALGEKHNATSSQISLAWLLSQGNDIIPIPGTKKIKYLKENLDAIKINLSPEEVKQVREVAERAHAPLADRSSPANVAYLFADTPEL